MARIGGLSLAVVAVACCAALSGRAALNRAGDPRAPPMSIFFKPGQTCWRYSGDEAYFTGKFRAGEHIVVTSAGESHFSDPATGREIARIAMRDMSVSQSKPYRPLDPSAEGEFRIPVTGSYDISFWPHAVQGFPGTLIVCKR
ncbi:MAG: hypothetical protein ACR2FH_03895 [Caulobacteraceae bacterium]